MQVVAGNIRYYVCITMAIFYHTVMCCLKTRLRSEQHVKQFCLANILTVYWRKPRWCSLLHTLAMWYNLLLLSHKPIQSVTVLKTVGNYNTLLVFVYLSISKHREGTVKIYYGIAFTYTVLHLWKHHYATREFKN